MNARNRCVRSTLLGFLLVVPVGLAAMGCGGSSKDSAPADLGVKKTPSQVLEEAKAESKAAKP